MYLTYISTVTGDVNRLELTEFNQDKTAKFFKAEAYTKHSYYEINQYKHLWYNNKCLGTSVEIFA